MSERIIENNRVIISGEITSDFTFSHEVCGEKFYTANLSTERTSGAVDTLPVTISDRVVDTIYGWKDQYVRISGQLRTYNKHEGEKNRLLLSVFATGFEEIEEFPFQKDENRISFDGYICKAPNYRKTPLGREIADLLVAVNRSYGKSDYIPCIVWGRNARFAGNLEVGKHIKLEGRLQSREYQKKISDTENETRVAYEVSASRIEVVEEAEES